MTFPCNLKPKADGCLSLETWRKAIQEIHTSKLWIIEIHCSHYPSVSCTILVRHFPEDFIGNIKIDENIASDSKNREWWTTEEETLLWQKPEEIWNEMDAIDSFSRWSNCFRRQGATYIIATVLLWSVEWMSRIWSSELFTCSDVRDSSIRWGSFGVN
jgi:hypothetical protein